MNHTTTTVNTSVLTVIKCFGNDWGGAVENLDTDESNCTWQIRLRKWTDFDIHCEIHPCL